MIAVNAYHLGKLIQCTLLKLLTILFYNRIAACRPRTIVLRSGGSPVRSFRPKQKAHFVACFQIGRRVWIVGTSYKIESRLLKHSHIAAMSSIGNCVTPAGLVLMSISSFYHIMLTVKEKSTVGSPFKPSETEVGSDIVNLTRTFVYLCIDRV